VQELVERAADIIRKGVTVDEAAPPEEFTLLVEAEVLARL